MSHGNWLSNIPAGVIAAWFWFAVACGFAVAIAWGPTARMLAAYDFEADERQCRSQYQEHDSQFAKRRATATENQTPSAPKEDTDPEKNARDYCVQRRSAIAGERQGDIAKLAAIVSFLALAAAFAAVIFARNAAEATRDTAEHAAASVDTLVTSERAILHIIVNSQNLQALIGNLVAGSHNEAEIRPGQLIVKYCFKNYGRTPARIRQMTIEMDHLSQPPQQIRYLPSGIYEPLEHFLSEDKTTTPTECHLRGSIDLASAQSIRAGQSSIFFYGRVLYDDIFGVEHEHRFFWRYSGPMDLFAPFYFRDYNKNT
jgi:hypothetical protein